MNLNIFQYFVPKEKKFFVLFEKASENLLACARKLTEVTAESDPAKRLDMIREIEKFEHAGDSLTHEIFNELGANFITPFDREDIHALATAIDDIVDYVHGASKRMELYKIEKPTTAMHKLSELILRSCEELSVAVSDLRNMKNSVRVREATVSINAIENHADDIFDNAIARLFEEESNAVEVIKQKDILSALETATDKCEDAANVIETIIVKYA